MTISGPYWSLAIEFQLYLLYPILILLTRRFGWSQMLMVTAFVEFISRVSLVVATHIAPNLYESIGWSWFNLSPFSFWFSWALGAVVAQAFIEGRALPFSRGPLPLWLWPLLALGIEQVPGLDKFSFPVAAFATARFLAYYLQRAEPALPSGKKSKSVQFLSFFGIISYSLYLIHVPLNVYFMEFSAKAHGSSRLYALQGAWIGVSLLLTVAISYLLYRMVEMPGIKLGKRVISWHRKQRNDPLLHQNYLQR